jgi:hypothetical protein
MRIAEWSLGRASGRLADVVQSRVYVTDASLADRARVGCGIAPWVASVLSVGDYGTVTGTRAG